MRYTATGGIEPAKKGRKPVSARHRQIVTLHTDDLFLSTRTTATIYGVILADSAIHILCLQDVTSWKSTEVSAWQRILLEYSN